MKKVLALLCTVLMLVSTFLPFTVSAENSGVSFSALQTYTTESTINVAPLTFEAVINIPKSVTGRAGVIFGNYQSKALSNSFEIYSNGVPRLYAWASSSSVTELEFTKVNVCTGSYLHLTITVDPSADKAYCYVDGELKQTLSCGGFKGLISPRKYMLGGDFRSGNAQYFKGSIKSVTLFSDYRDAQEIKSDVTKIDTSDENLIVSYDLSLAGGARLKDASKNSNDLIYEDPQSGLENVGGFVLSDATSYNIDKPFSDAPQTLEAWVNIPKEFSDRGGVIVGNYGAATPCINFEIYSNGQPRLYYVDSSSNTRSLVFDKVDVRTGTWSHVAIVYDVSANNVKCYLNGELKQSLTAYGKIDPKSYVNAMGFAGDPRSGNAQYFKGALKSVTLFSDARSADEIKADMSAVSLSSDGLLAHYDLSGVKVGENIKDLSQNAYNITCVRTWFKDKDEVTDYAYSFCVVGDTQKVAYLYPDKFHHIYDWIVASKESKKIEFVFGLGDITDKNTVAEWKLVKTEISKLNGVVPYSLVRGNHDGSAYYNQFFGGTEYKKQFNGFYDSKIENSWRTFTVCDVDYLLITLDYGASDAILNWAAGIIETHPEHRVIITTHAYLFRDGTTLDVNDVVPPNKTGSNDGKANNGDQMWDKLISKYENIFLVMSGHDPCDNIIVAQDKGIHGNTVTQMLIDPQGVDAAQGATGMVAMLYFSNDGKTLTIENYSTVRNEYYMSTSQMTIEIPEYKKASESETTPEETTQEDPSDQTTVPSDPPAQTAPSGDNTEALPPANAATKGCASVSFAAAVALALATVPTAFIFKKKELF